jgi:hypothetical protein
MENLRFDACFHYTSVILIFASNGTVADETQITHKPNFVYPRVKVTYKWNNCRVWTIATTRRIHPRITGNAMNAVSNVRIWQGSDEAMDLSQPSNRFSFSLDLHQLNKLTQSFWSHIYCLHLLTAIRVESIFVLNVSLNCACCLRMRRS